MGIRNIRQKATKNKRLEWQLRYANGHSKNRTASSNNIREMNFLKNRKMCNNNFIQTTNLRTEQQVVLTLEK